MQPLNDNHGRTMDYLRLAVTERCNLRCQYCMPENGIQLQPKKEILTWEEQLRLSKIFIGLGVKKIRITGGEPFVRRGLMGFISELKAVHDSLIIGITTNGTLINQHLQDLSKLGVQHLNFSLDSLDSETFHRITRRDHFAKTVHTIESAIEMGFRVKVNMVAIPGMNLHEIPEFVEWTRIRNMEVRFIEPMPFDGNGKTFDGAVSGDEIREIIQAEYPLEEISGEKSAVATRFRVPDFAGTVGIIYGASRSFCGTCSRLRVSAQGQMRTCLYGLTVLDLRHLLRSQASDGEIISEIRGAVNRRYKDGFAAEQARKESQFDSMAAIGG
jgi:cyclic pyranopterin phosphate synthase